MEYFIIGLIFIVFVSFLIPYFQINRSKKNLETIREKWGKVKNEPFYFNRIANYANAFPVGSFHRLSQQTIEDIDFHALFEFVDRTSSKVGQQYLYKKMLEPSNQVSDPLEAFIHLFSKDEQLREAVQLELHKLSNEGAYFIPTLLSDQELKEPKWLKWLYVNLLVIVAFLALAFIDPGFLIILIVPLSVNMFVHYWNKNNTLQYLNSFPQLSSLIHVAGAVNRNGGIFEYQSVKKSIKNLASFQKQVRLISLENGTGIQSEFSQFGVYLLELIKSFFLIEVIALFRITKELKEKKRDIQNLFEYIGKIDSAISVASLRAGTAQTCIPEFSTAVKAMEVSGMHHPLIEHCIENELTIENKSILITGSNMSGKSTFLRTLIINSILAQTIYTCFASRFKSPMLKQFSSIRIDEDLFEGKSYYFQEVSIMASLLNQVESSDQKLFVLDEVFKGTNTIERIAAAKAILSYLNRKNHIVLVATHDHELAELLSKEYDLYHFTELVKDNELHFDHRIKIGPLKTRNAIKVLELSNYPEDVIQEARMIALKLDKAQQASD